MHDRVRFPGEVRINGYWKLRYSEQPLGYFFFNGIRNGINSANGGEAIHVGLCGGKTPQEAYQALGEDCITPWEKIHFWQIDERAVPYDHPDNNGSMIIQNTPKLMRFWSRNFHRIKTELGPEDAAEAYEKELRSFFPDGKPKLDLLVTSITPDGHVASLFPHSPALEVTERSVISTYVEKLSAHRITMTMPLLQNARVKVILGNGADRAERAYQLYSKELDPKEVPLAGLNLNYWTYWMLSLSAGERIIQNEAALEKQFDQRVIHQV